VSVSPNEDLVSALRQENLTVQSLIRINEQLVRDMQQLARNTQQLRDTIESKEFKSDETTIEMTNTFYTQEPAQTVARQIQNYSSAIS
jgi:hypothetical protein